MREHTAEDATRVLDAIEDWQGVYHSVLGHRLVFAADEYYLMAGRPFPGADTYEGFSMHEDGIGMAALFADEWHGRVAHPTGPQSGFFAWVDGAPAEGYRAPRNPAGDTGLAACTSGSHAGVEVAVTVGRASRGPIPTAVLTGEYGARIIQPLLAELNRDNLRVLAVRNDFFGGNTAVTGLMVGSDIARVLADEPAGHRYLLPDVCLSEGRFLDGTTVHDLPHRVEVVPTDGIALRRALEPAR
jgi:NifB/MoaA-like Fe-S oxidoreductase